MSAPGHWRFELLDDDVLDELDRRAGYHGPARAARAVAYLLIEQAHAADEAGDFHLEADLLSASDDLEYAATTMLEHRVDLARRFLAAAIATLPELAETDAIDQITRWIGESG